jgi:hypothetical protein
MSGAAGLERSRRAVLVVVRYISISALIFEVITSVFVEKMREAVFIEPSICTCMCGSGNWMV